MFGNPDERPNGPLEPFSDRSHLLPPGTIGSVMKGMHDASAP